MAGGAVAGRGKGRRKQGRGRAAAPRRRERGWRRAFRLGALLVLAVGFVGGFFASRYLIQADRVVRARFEGRLFRVPSRVHSAPTILYPGLDWQRVGLRDTLVRLGYREARGAGSLPVGRFRWSDREVRVHSRAFEHPGRAEPARQLRIALRGARIEALSDLETGRELGAAFLEPELVGAYYGPDRAQRDLVRVGEVPTHLVDAVLAVEDQRFLSHRGIDARRILGALWVNLQSRGIRQGGSTLTQQLVKNFFLTPERSFRRKAQEAVMALIVEARYDKTAILESYLNEIYLGQRGSTAIHGVGEASRFYFGKRAHHLTLPESALLAAIIKSPNGLSPHRSAEAAQRRRDLVLRLMEEQGRIDEVAYQEALAVPLGVSQVAAEPRDARFFLDVLRRQLPDFYGWDTLTSEGLEIYSTLDLRLQIAAARAVHDGLAALEEARPALGAKPEEQLQACLIALRPQTGEVLALVGGRDYGSSQFDRCTQARRQAGSAFKPIVYAAALEPVPGGPAITLASLLDDAPLEIGTPAGPWRPVNFDRKFHGPVAVRDALEQSLNVATARLAQRLGAPRIVAVARRLGVESPLPAVPSLALGAADLSPLELVRVYATLANGGIRPQVRTFEDVVDGEGRIAQRQPIAFERVLDPGTAYLVTTLLEGVVDRGTARAIRAAGIVGPVAGKTGTTNEERDAWFVGFSPELVVGVWVGFDQPRSIGLPSSRVALPIWIRFFREATGGRARGVFAPPGDVARVDVDPETGALALAGCPRRRPEYFLRGTEPRETCPSWASPRRDRRDGEERGLIERLFEAWLDRL